MSTDELVAEAIENNKPFALLDEVQRTATFAVRPADDDFDAPHIRNAAGNCLPLAIIVAYCASLNENGGDAQRSRVPGEIDAFVSLLSDSDGFEGDAPDPNDPEWDGFTTDIWFGFDGPLYYNGIAEVEVLLTYFRP